MVEIVRQSSLLVELKLERKKNTFYTYKTKKGDDKSRYLKVCVNDHTFCCDLCNNCSFS